MKQFILFLLPNFAISRQQLESATKARHSWKVMKGNHGIGDLSKK
jgi:hypothetical protein